MKSIKLITFGLVVLLAVTSRAGPVVIQHPQQLLANQFGHMVKKQEHHAKIDFPAPIIKQDEKDVLDLEQLKGPISDTLSSPAAIATTGDEITELEKELKSLNSQNKSQARRLGQEEETAYGNKDSSEERLPQPTEQQALEEQQRIDEEIHNENTKDSGTYNGKIYPGAARFTSSSTSNKGSSGDDESSPISAQQEQAELLKEPPQQNEDNTNMFTNNGQRRNFQMNTVDEELPSLLMNKPKIESMETLLKNSGGQYSAYDIAQYVFWTGDEAGVAHAIEELIEERLMSRENAIKFLRDIRLGIEYLQNSYANHDFTDSNKKEKTNQILNKSGIKILKQMTTTTSRPKTTIAPFTSSVTLSPVVLKAIENIPNLLKMGENAGNKNSVGEKINIDYDDSTGRLRLADFLYAEYSLEEVIYQLAKVMFSQSLTKGSSEAQTALERLTAFLESEGNEGRISPALQKKVLDVLLSALSDTFAEHPEILTAARAHLGDSLERVNNN